jgi:hypothetical protein
VEKVLRAIHRQVMSLALKVLGAGSAGFSYVGRPSMLSTRPSVEGRFSTMAAVDKGESKGGG